MVQWELGAATLLKTVWWDLRLARLLTHLFFLLFFSLSEMENKVVYIDDELKWTENIQMLLK